MGLLEPHVGHGGRDRQARLSLAAKAITVHSLRQAKAATAAAAETGHPVLLLSAPAAAGTVGPAWFDAVVRMAASAFPGAAVEGALDCGDMPGHALAALRYGMRTIRYDGPAFDAIADIAAQCGATVMRDRPHALDLSTIAGRRELGDPDDAAMLIEACRRWLQEVA